MDAPSALIFDTVDSVTHLENSKTRRRASRGNVFLVAYLPEPAKCIRLCFSAVSMSTSDTALSCCFSNRIASLWTSREDN
jgi:hypothetical protein